MAEGFRVAVLGATGLVGQQMIEILQQRDFPVAQLYPLASARSVGATVSFKGEDVEVIDAETFDWSEADIGFFLPAVRFQKYLLQRLLRPVVWL